MSFTNLCFGVGVILLTLAPPPTYSFSRGAGSASCRDMTPAHIRIQQQNLQQSYVTIRASASSYVPGQLVTVTIRSSRDFMGFLLQARRAEDLRGGAEGGSRFGSEEESEVLVGGTWLLTPSGAQTLHCISEGDSVTHSDKQLKRNLSFVWRAPDAPIGDVRFCMAVVQSYFVYWANIQSAVLHDKSRQMWNKTTQITEVQTSFVHQEAEVVDLPGTRAYLLTNYSKNGTTTSTTPRYETNRVTKFYNSTNTEVSEVHFKSKTFFENKPFLSANFTKSNGSRSTTSSLPLSSSVSQQANAITSMSSISIPLQFSVQSIRQKETGTASVSSRKAEPKNPSQDLVKTPTLVTRHPHTSNYILQLRNLRRPLQDLKIFTQSYATSHSYFQTILKKKKETRWSTEKTQTSTFPSSFQSKSNKSEPIVSQKIWVEPFTESTTSSNTDQSSNTLVKTFLSNTATYPVTHKYESQPSVQVHSGPDQATPQGHVMFPQVRQSKTRTEETQPPQTVIPLLLTSTFGWSWKPVSSASGTSPNLVAVHPDTPLSTSLSAFNLLLTFSLHPPHTTSSPYLSEGPPMRTSHPHDRKPVTPSSSAPTTLPTFTPTHLTSTQPSPSIQPPTTPPSSSTSLFKRTWSIKSSTFPSNPPTASPSRPSASSKVLSTSAGKSVPTLPFLHSKSPAFRRSPFIPSTSSSDPMASKKLTVHQKLLVRKPSDPELKVYSTTQRTVAQQNFKPHQEHKLNLGRELKPSLPKPPSRDPDKKLKYPDIVPRHSDWELGMLLGCAAGLGMVLVVGVRYMYRKACGKRNQVTLTDREREYGRGERGLIHVQECGDLVRVRKIRENSFVLLAEYDLLPTSGD